MWWTLYGALLDNPDPAPVHHRVLQQQHQQVTIYIPSFPLSIDPKVNNLPSEVTAAQW